MRANYKMYTIRSMSDIYQCVFEECCDIVPKYCKNDVGVCMELLRYTLESDGCDDTPGTDHNQTYPIDVIDRGMSFIDKVGFMNSEVWYGRYKDEKH